MLTILAERRFPAESMRAIATKRSRGRSVPFGDEELVVDTLDDAGFEDLDLLLIDTPDDAARDLAPRAVEAGAIVVDNSAAWRMEDRVPLVVPECNPYAIDSHEGLIASPNCTTIAFVVPLAALHRAFDLERLFVSSYQAVSGAGQRGVDELQGQAGKMAEALDALASGDYKGLVPDPEVFPAPVAFNVVPMIGTVSDGGFTNEEWKMVHETRKIMSLPDLPVSGTCVRVDAVVGHGVSVHARFSEEIDAEEATGVLREAEGVKVVPIPTAQMAAGKDDCYVGRIRSDPHDPRSLWFFSACDNLRKGAALNAVQIAQRLLP